MQDIELFCLFAFYQSSLFGRYQTLTLGTALLPDTAGAARMNSMLFQLVTSHWNENCPGCAYCISSLRFVLGNSSILTQDGKFSDGEVIGGLRFIFEVISLGWNCQHSTEEVFGCFCHGDNF
jgi:hypothetical protein